MLYDYLEEYLYGRWYVGSFKQSYTYDGWDPELKGTQGLWLTKGVMEFQPECHGGTVNGEDGHLKDEDWPWVFVFPVPDTGKQHTGDSMATMVGRSAHEWIGKRTTPHLMRRIWATWAFQLNLDDRLIHSMAYAVGSSYETLKKWYEQSTPQDKRRAIEEHIDEFFMDYLEQIQGDAPNNSPEFRKVLQLLPKLSQEEQLIIVTTLQVG
ncbi:MAG: hypothetical protein F6K04_21050 [Leptolyngbya sp. SIO4C5]|nr:hypothetical protein [Leptolyngbya sp. SIO4C5]